MSEQSATDGRSILDPSLFPAGGDWDIKPHGRILPLAYTCFLRFITRSLAAETISTGFSNAERLHELPRGSVECGGGRMRSSQQIIF